MGPADDRPSPDGTRLARNKDGPLMIPDPEATSGTNVFQAAYDKHLPRILALPADKLMTLNCDIPWATSTSLGAVARVLTLRDQAAQLPFFDIACFDDIQGLALTLSHAYALFRAADRPEDDLETLGRQAYEWRGRLRACVVMLMATGALRKESLHGYQGRKGYRNVAADLQILTSILIDVLPEVEGKCPFTRQDLNAAANLAASVLSTVGFREQAPKRKDAAADVLVRAFTAFWQCWAEVRAAVTFLRRHEGDADEIAPSVYSPRKRREPGASGGR